MTHEESPIHPLLSRLIETYKQFSSVEFPRGRPEPIARWQPLLKTITKFEARCIPQIHKYLNGETLELPLAQLEVSEKTEMANFKTSGNPDTAYLKKLQNYLTEILNLSNLLEQCLKNLGNPCQTYRQTSDSISTDS